MEGSGGSYVFGRVVRKGLSVEMTGCREVEGVRGEATQNGRGDEKSEGPEPSLNVVAFDL